jgi:hypothetical protein
MKKITREELYAKIWATPMVALCKEFGLSDRGLAKLCQRLNVPVPPRGYWRQLECGHQPTKMALPETYTAREATIQGPRQETPLALTNVATIRVPERLTNPHELIASTLEYYRLPEKTRWDVGRHLKRVDIRVHDASRARALRIFNTIIRALEDRKVSVLLEDQKTFAVIGLEKIPFHIHEYSKLVLREEPEKAKTDRWYRPERDFTPTGRLSFVFDGRAFGLNTSFRDGKRQRLEDMAGQIVESVCLIGEAAERHALQQRKEDELRRERDRLRYEEEQRVRRLLHAMEQWEMQRRLERYLRALKRDPSADESWIAWVEGYLLRFKLS